MHDKYIGSRNDVSFKAFAYSHILFSVRRIELSFKSASVQHRERVSRNRVREFQIIHLILFKNHVNII